MDELIAHQSNAIAQFQIIKRNFKKDSTHRKTAEYIKKRLDVLENLWGEFIDNHEKICKGPESESQKKYLEAETYETGTELYNELKLLLSEFGKVSEKATMPDGKMEEFLSQQRAQFRALDRQIKSIDLGNIAEKWEIEDELKNLQKKWKTIDTLHIQIDSIVSGGDINYEDEFIQHENKYKKIKRALNQKLESNIHMKQCTPTLEIPSFSGKYINWPNFYDLFTETIHNNQNLTKAQKFQHLKSKIKGEAERLIAHLHITPENYDTAWSILVHRYSNIHLLFSKNIEILLNQHNISKQSAFELRRMYDTTNECIHAIHNLGVDTPSWDPLIVHLLCKKLDPQTYTDFKENRKEPRELPTFEEFMTFLENKFMALEPIYRKEKEVPSTATSSNQTKQRANPYHTRSSFNKQPYSQTDKNYQVMTTHTSKCFLCKMDHDLFACKQFIGMTPETRLKTVLTLEVCKNCLYKHYGKPCTSTKRCKECDSEHNTMLHDPAHASASVPTSKVNQKKVYHIAMEVKETLLPTALVNIRAADGTLVKARALLDQAAQVSIISESLVQVLGLKRYNSRFSSPITGIDLCEKKCNGAVSIEINSMYQDYQYQTEALIVSKVAYDLPNVSFKHEPMPHLQDLSLADPRFNVSQRVEILLGADVYCDVIMKGLRKGHPGAPMAQETKLGWIISGNVTPLSCYAVAKNINISEESVSISAVDLSKYWEIEDINNSSPTLTEADTYCENFYQQTTHRLENGRYVVAIPMKPDYEKHLGSSKVKAIAQFKQMENRLAKNPSLSENYKQFMREYLELGHMRKVITPNDHAHYIPHHGVQRLESLTTKLRVVFNASSKTTSGKSLNDVMYSGPNLQQDLQAIILNWRIHKYVITADIEKMFRQFLIRDQDQHLQCIIWRESAQEILQEFQLCTVSYGTKAAPWLAMRTLRQLAKDEAINYPLAAAVIETSCYTDDILTGSNSIEHAKKLQKELINIFLSANMNLRKWSSNSKQLLSNLTPNHQNNALEFKSTETRKTLGLKWNPVSDSFTYQNQITEKSDKHLTKRELLSEISRLFDPLGWLSPLSIRAKLLFQGTWSQSMDWDDKVSCEIQDQWNQLRGDLINIEKFDIPRHLGDTQQTCYLHGFCDASINAYAAALYIVTTNDKGERTSRLIAAKTKLAPLAKKVSLPRLELLGALLLSELTKKTLQCFSGSNIKLHAWSDSMIVLGWLHGDNERWKQFVANRSKQISEIIPPACWRHVKSEDNPADCATRGLTTTQLAEHKLWWTGPEWMPTYKTDESKISYQSPNIETKKPSVYATLQRNNITIVNELLSQYNSITRVTKVLGWVLRFIKCARDKHRALHSYDKVLTSCEMNNARTILIKEVQGQDFAEDLEYIKEHGHVGPKSKIISLNPFVDDTGLLRVGGRLHNADISKSAKHPIILSCHGRLTDLVIHQAHMLTLHGGPRLTLSYIRDQFWIISGIRTVKRQLRQCVRCRRFSIDKNQHIMADLPQPRVTPSRPFTHTGVDFTGFVELKINKGRGIKTCKGYIAVFVCLSTKAIHLELVSDLSTPTFLAAFRRFCARRGVPGHMYSDNGTNFIGADRLLKQEYKEIMQNINTDFFNSINDFNITWHKNAPCWPSAGGLWESAVKSMKYHLKRVLGDQKLTYEEFTTLLHQIEACLNSRPLCQLIESPDDEYLTPGHFLVGGPLLSRPQTEPESVTLSQRWQLVQTMNKHFWKRWSAEYLQQLQTRTKWRSRNQNLKVDDVVLIKEDNLPPGKYALGRVQDLHQGQDGCVRVVTLKTRSNIIKRPVSKLIVLPVQEEETPTQQATQQNDQPSTSDQGQDQPSRMQLRPRPRNLNYKNFFITMLVMFTTIISPSTQLMTDQATFKVSTFNDSQNLFFDKILDLQFIKDEWKMVIYYNMTPYWEGISKISTYLEHIKQTAKGERLQYQNIISQLEHEMDEVEHYNRLLLDRNVHRQKRGLINGIGYIANSLFGVLDDRFAEQYKKDVEKIGINENHLQDLMRNQTSVLESEYNILKRNERAMSLQFKFIKAQIHNLSLTENRIQYDSETGLYITSAALTANMILTNIRRIQQTLISTVTDISHGRIDPHLLLPEEMEHQMNIISGQLKGDLILPVKQPNIKDMYKLLKAAARIYKGYLLIEIKIPLLSSDVFELNRIITIPQNKDNKSAYISPVEPYIAYNLKKDIASFLSYNDLEQCIHSLEEKLLCTSQLPIYDLQIKQSICSIKLLSTNSDSMCKTFVTTCRDRWIKLHKHNDWMFACCSECHVRIQCPGGITIKQLSGTGIITLGDDCKLKGSGYTIYTHNNNFFSKMNISTKLAEAPEVSVLNKIIYTSALSFDQNFNTTTELEWDDLINEIKLLKEQSFYQLNTHDVHHYVMLYSIIVIIGVGAIIAIGWRWRRNRCLAMARREPAVVYAVSATAAPQPRPRSRVNSVGEVNVNGLGASEPKCGKGMSAGTSPVIFKSKLSAN